MFHVIAASFLQILSSRSWNFNQSSAFERKPRCGEDGRDVRRLRAARKCPAVKLAFAKSALALR